MLRRYAVARLFILTFALALLPLAVAAPAWGTAWYPGYYCATLPGVSNDWMQQHGYAASPQGWSLLSNGTVIGDSTDIQGYGEPPSFPYQEGLVWTVSGKTVTMTDLGNIEGLAANGACEGFRECPLRRRPGAIRRVDRQRRASRPLERHNVQ